ncbi:MAG: leucyl aminopeptidase [Candidatus Nanopelagicales bacterium]|nr:leucyl aminopeptidase [Candidatus Nanopelagicales bacterium]
MTTLRISDADVTATRAGVLIVGVNKQGSLQIVSGALPAAVRKAIASDLEKVACDGEPGGLWRIPAPGSVAADSVIAVATPAKPDAEQLRKVAGAGVRAAGGSKSVVLALPTPNEATLAAVCEGALLGAHVPLRVSAKPSKGAVGTLIVATTAPRAVRSAVKRNAVADVTATNLARDLVNQPPVTLTPVAFASTAKKTLKGSQAKVTVWDADRLVKEGMGGMVGVGQGSANPPRLIVLEYAPKDAKKHLALVGKGITFDSGGLSLKPPKAMETMKCDMAGAAAVLAAVTTIAELGLPVHVTGYLACAENMPGGHAQRPGDVITMRNEKTVEVLNTDAEGRLVMADALALAGESQPDIIIDVATLTGAQMIALGNQVAAVMSNDPQLADTVKAAGESVGEPFWPMPLPESLKASLKSPLADLKNIGDQYGGMLTAGLFLQEFVPGDIAWAHLDIAGPAFNEAGPHGFTPKGGTGFAARTLVQLARELGR